MIDTCGFCSGRGTVPGPTNDRHGYPLPEHDLCCEYCGGTGCCEDGGQLLAAVPRPQPERPNAGLPPWANYWTEREAKGDVNPRRCIHEVPLNVFCGKCER